MRPFLLVLALALAPWLPGQETVANTVHNLSRSGPGRIKSATSDDVCGFCHVPHSASPASPLWGHTLSPSTYTVYRSDTLVSAVPQPNGASTLCLACHDGTIALGDLRGRKVPLAALSPGQRGFLGTDLSGGHPVSMEVTAATVDASAAASSPLAGLPQMTADQDGVILDGKHRMQCTSCHDPHADRYFSASGIHFWRKPTFSETCLVCHLP
jgi:hypothetical protein